MADSLNFRELLIQHQAMVYSIAYRMLGDSGLAEEVAQDVFLELNRNISRLSSPEHALYWLRKVAASRATDALRKRRLWPEYGAEELLEEDATEADRPETEIAIRLEELLLTLPPAQRAVLLLRYQEDLGPPEIATTLAMPLATVKSHLRRGLETLRTKAERSLKEFSRDTV